MIQVRYPDDVQTLWITLGRVDVQTRVVAKWNHDTDMNMKKRPSECRAADEELNKLLALVDAIQASSWEVRE